MQADVRFVHLSVYQETVDLEKCDCCERWIEVKELAQVRINPNTDTEQSVQLCKDCYLGNP